MRRGAFHLASAFSLLIAIAVAVSWPVSYYRPHGVALEGSRRFTISAERGIITLEHQVYRYFVAAPPISYAPATTQPSTKRFDNRWSIHPRVSTARQFLIPFSSPSVPSFGSISAPIPKIFVINGIVRPLPTIWFPVSNAVFFPHWFALLLSLLLPLISLARRLRAQHQIPGACPHCGYDLRATPDRCPECGNAAPATSSHTPPAPATP